MNLEDISYHLKMQVNHDIGKKMTFCQNTYLKKIIDRFQMIEYKLASIPINPRIRNYLLLYDRDANIEIRKSYQSAIESFMWPVIHICSDIAYAVEILR